MSGFSKPVQLATGTGIEGFSCGDETVDSWVRDHSASARKRGSAVVYVVYHESDVAGFYTLSSHSVSRADVCGGWFARNAPRSGSRRAFGHDGRRRAFQRRGLGASLLRDAIQNALKVAAIAGAAGAYRGTRQRRRGIVLRAFWLLASSGNQPDGASAFLGRLGLPLNHR